MPYVGHPGYQKIISAVKRQYYWLGMKREIVEYIVKCLELGSYSKMATRYCGPFEILERIGSVAYMLALSALLCIHNFFHVSMFKQYVLHVNHIIDWNVIQVKLKGDF